MPERPSAMGDMSKLLQREAFLNEVQQDQAGCSCPCHVFSDHRQVTAYFLKQDLGVVQILFWHIAQAQK